MIKYLVHQRIDPFRDLVHESQLLTLQWMPDKSRQGEYLQARSDQNGGKTWLEVVTSDEIQLLSPDYSLDRIHSPSDQR